MKEDWLLKALLQEKRLRTRLHLDEDRIGDAFQQLSGDIHDLVTTKKIGFKLGIESIFRADYDRSTEIGANRKLLFINKAILIEYYAREKGLLIDLYNRQVDEAENADDVNIVRFEGKCHLTRPGKSVSPEDSGLRPDVAKKIQNERMRQEEDMKEDIKSSSEDQDSSEEINTLTGVWTATIGRTNLACIALWAKRNRPAINSLPPKFNGTIGISGTLEQEIDDIVFVSPFWIWRY
jgi:hypothetical protein